MNALHLLGAVAWTLIADIPNDGTMRYTAPAPGCYAVSVIGSCFLPNNDWTVPEESARSNIVCKTNPQPEFNWIPPVACEDGAAIASLETYRFYLWESSEPSSQVPNAPELVTLAPLLGAPDMAAPVIESTTITNTEANETSNQIDIPMPATRPDGDLYFLLIGLDGTGQRITLTGWTEIVDEDGGGTDSIAAYWRYGSSEPATYTATHASGVERATKIVVRISNPHPSDPIGLLTTTTKYTSTQATSTAPTGTTEKGDSLIFHCYSVDTRYVTSVNVGSEVGFSSNVGSDTGTAMAAIGQTTNPGEGSTTTAQVATLNLSEQSAVFTVEILPAIGSPSDIARSRNNFRMRGGLGVALQL